MCLITHYTVMERLILAESSSRTRLEQKRHLAKVMRSGTAEQTMNIFKQVLTDERVVHKVDQVEQDTHKVDQVQQDTAKHILSKIKSTMS